MKKLLAAAAVAAAAFVPTALPAGATGGEPTSGETMLCTLDYHSGKYESFGGTVLGNDAYITGSCLSLATLESYPVSTPLYASFGGGSNDCVSPAAVNLTIGTTRHFGAWSPALTVPPQLPGLPGLLLGMPTSAVFVATGPVNTTDVNSNPNGSGLGTFVGTANCTAGTMDGTMVLTFTKP